MAIYESRKKTLTETFGTKTGTKTCIDNDSVMKASLQDLMGSFDLYSDDTVFMYNNKNYCTEAEAPKETKMIIREYNGISADITVNGTVIGKTNTFITMQPGDYSAKISANGYIDQMISFTAVEGKTTEYKYVKLVKKTTETEEEEEEEEEGSNYETHDKIGPVLLQTGNSKIPSPIKVGEYQWFGTEFKNTGDTKWQGIVGIKLINKQNAEFVWEGDSSIIQTIQPSETKYLWAYAQVTSFTMDDGTRIFTILKRTNN